MKACSTAESQRPGRGGLLASSGLPRANEVAPDRLRDSASTVAASARTAPVDAKVMPAERPSSPSPLVIIEMSNAPTAACARRPRPPKRLTPPTSGGNARQHDVSAGRGLDGPYLACREETRDHGEAGTEDECRDAQPSDIDPARLAASGLPPTAYMCRPNRVRSSMTVPTQRIGAQWARRSARPG